EIRENQSRVKKDHDEIKEDHRKIKENHIRIEKNLGKIHENFKEENDRLDKMLKDISTFNQEKEDMENEIEEYIDNMNVDETVRLLEDLRPRKNYSVLLGCGIIKILTNLLKPKRSKK
ncbi:MAG: hypothetical protein AMS24_03500, partial [Chlamydiae bacterium SM23_39]